MQTVRISMVDGKPCSGHYLCGYGSDGDGDGSDGDGSTGSHNCGSTNSNQECDCQPCPMCGMRVGGTAVELCQDLHKEFDDNNQRLSCIDGLPCCFNGCNEASCECQNCTLCDKRTAGSILTLNSDYTKMVNGLGPIAYPVTWICSSTGSTRNPLTDAPGMLPFFLLLIHPFPPLVYTEGGTRHKG